MTKYKLGNLDELFWHDVRNYQNAPIMRFVMNVVLYAFCCVRKMMDYYDLCSG